jgi:hypothetical protein
LCAAWAARSRAPRQRGRVVAITVRVGGGVHEKKQAVDVSVELGVDGDRWSDGVRRRSSQVSLMNVGVARIASPDADCVPESGDNFLVDFDLAEDHLPSGAVLRVGESLLRVTDKPHLGCKKFARRFGVEAMKWVNLPEYRRERLRGVYCEVLAAGTVCVGDVIELRGDDGE